MAAGPIARICNECVVLVADICGVPLADTREVERRREAEAALGWRPIITAPKGKDNPPILVRLKDPIVAPGRDVQHWSGRVFVAAHLGVEEDGFDIGWHFAAPVGMGGFPDDWIEGWLPIPVANTPGTDTVRR